MSLFEDKGWHFKRSAFGTQEHANLRYWRIVHPFLLFIPTSSFQSLEELMEVVREAEEEEDENPKVFFFFSCFSLPRRRQESASPGPFVQEAN